MEEEKTIIRIRRGINGFKYSVCHKNGYFIGNCEKLADVRKHWLEEIKLGYVELVRELDKMPDMSLTEKTIENLNKLLKILAEQ